MNLPGKWWPALAAALLTIALTASAASAAAAAAPAAQRDILLAHTMPNLPGSSLTALIVAYPPGGKSPPHHHACSAFTFVYVLSGAIRSQVEGQPVHIFKAGQHWFELPCAHHVISENASATEPARMLVIYAARTGDRLMTPDR